MPIPAGDPSIPSDPTSPTATGKFFMAYTEGGLSPTPVKLGATVTVVWPNAAAVDAYEWAPGREEPRKGAPNASAGAAAVHANASPAASAAMAFRTRHHADAQAKRCAAGPEARVCSDSSSDDDVSSTSRRDARPARLLRASRAQTRLASRWTRRVVVASPDIYETSRRERGWRGRGFRPPRASRPSRGSSRASSARTSASRNACFTSEPGAQTSARVACDAGRFDPRGCKRRQTSHAPAHRLKNFPLSNRPSDARV